MNRRLNRRIWTRVGAGLGVAVIVFVAVFSYRSCLPGSTFEDGRAFAATLEPTSLDSLGVAPDSSFVLTLGQAVSPAAVRAALSVEPPVEVSVRAKDKENKVYTITPQEPLEADRVYRIALSLAGPDEPGYSWAYQVRGKLRVAGTLPGNRSSGVPVNTGIEIVFSHDGVNEPGSHFSITPFVPGTWERHRRTLVYVPSVPLKPATVYTCTVKAGLGVQGSAETLAEDYVFSFETAPGSAGEGPGFYFWVGDEASEYAPSEPPFFWVNYGRYGEPSGAMPAVNVKVYRYRDAAAYVAGLKEREQVPYWASASRRNLRPSVVGTTPILDADLVAQTVQWQTYLVLPEAVEPGYYLASFHLAPYTFYTWFQVTELSSYVVEATNDTVIWFNSLATGQPVPGVNVTTAQAGPPLGTSNASGVARFRTPDAVLEQPGGGSPGVYEPIPPYYLIARAPGGAEAVLDLSPSWNPYTSQLRLVDDYWTYLYTDRPLYLPHDEVCFWGVLEPRERGVAEMPVVRVELRTSDGGWEGPFGRGLYSGGGGGEGDATLILAQDVQVQRHVYSGRVALPNLRPGYYHLDVTSGGSVLASQYFEVRTYTKPAYRVALTADKKAVFAGQPVRFTLDASFFEGTPVSELRLAYNLYTGGSTLTTGALTTDAAGRASLTHTPPQETDVYALERQDVLQVTSNLPESGWVFASAGVRVFDKDVALRASASSEVASGADEAAGMAIEARLNKVTLDAINASSEPSFFGEPDYLGDPVVGREVSAQIEEVQYKTVETGQYYDFVEKVVRKTYDYTEVHVPVTTLSMITGEDGVARASFAPDPRKYYHVTVTSRDDAGRPIGTQLYFCGRSFVGPDYSYHWYNLAPADRELPRYEVGERVTVVARDRQATLPPRAAGYLFYTARKGLQTVAVTGQPEYSLTFEERLIPNVNVGGVYFDGRYYNALGEMQAAFAYEGRKLDLTVTTDQPSYRPGDRVVVSLEVKDGDGRPVVAEVNLCLVDEALYHMSGQEVNLLGSLYGRTLGSYVLSTRASHYKRLEPGGGAECGEGGEVREDFRDQAYFATLTTGGDGRATAEFKLPDNLTSWRLTYQAFAAGVRAGSGTIGIPVRLPFFVELATNETYLSGDQPIIHARAYGAALPSGTPVEFTATLGRQVGAESYDTKDLTGVSGTAFRPVGIDLGRLEKGRCRLTVTGKAVLPDGTVLEDTLARPLEVLDTYLRLDRVEYYRVAEGLRLSAEPGELVTLTFCDQERGKCLEMLWRLAGGGRRVDMKVAEAVARRLLADEFGYEEWGAAGAAGGSDTGAGGGASDLMVFQAPNGGIALLPYADPDLELTAEVAALHEALGEGAGFDRSGLLNYLGQIYDCETETRERFIIALYGLAALGEPVLNDVRKVAAEPDLSVKEKLYACLALAEFGDGETARELFGGLLETYGDRIGPLLRLNVSRDQEEIIAATSLAAVIEAQLKMPDRQALFEYLLDNVPWEELNFLELVRYVQVTVPRAPSEAVSFTIKPEGTQVALKPGETYTCLRTAEQLVGLGFANVHGEVGLCVAYRAPASLSHSKITSGEATLNRTYSVAGKATTTFESGDLVKITLGYRVTGQAPAGPYQLVDFLPSGLKIVARPYEVGVQDANLRFPAEVDGQKITFSIYTPTPELDPKTGQPISRDSTGTVTYYARVVSLGSYRAEPAVLIHAKSGVIFAATEEAGVGIK